jgi:hypothetical protein
LYWRIDRLFSSGNRVCWRILRILKLIISQAYFYSVTLHVSTLEALGDIISINSLLVP